jgi:membrane-bound serine protease (ClpP class)
LLSARAVDTARQTLVSVALVMSGIFGFVVYKVAQARRMKVKAGPEQLIGLVGIAVSRLDPRGEIKVEGQIWKAETVSQPVNEGETVEILGREGLILRVKPKQAQT